MNAGSNGFETVGAQTWPVVVAGAAVAVSPLPAEATSRIDAPTPTPAPPTGTASSARAEAGAAAHNPAPAQPTAAASSDATASLTATLTPAAPAQITSAGTVHAGTAQPAAAFAAAPNPAGTFGGTVLALLLVVGLILALAWLARRMPGLGAGGNPALKIVGSLALGPRERVVVVDVGGTQLLLATGAGGTRALHTLEQPLPAAAAPASPFAQVLAQQFGKKKP